MDTQRDVPYGKLLALEEELQAQCEQQGIDLSDIDPELVEEIRFDFVQD